MEGALGGHYDYLRDVLLPPPVGPIARALGAMKDTAAAPLLTSHLLDPADSDQDVKGAASALEQIAGPKELPVMRQFFAMYRASADTDDLALAVVAVGKALLALDGKTGRALVEAAARDPDTVATVKQRLEAALSNGKPADDGK